MAPDFYESDHLASDADISGQPETIMHEPQPTASRPVRRSLFQIVCIDGAPTIEPPTSL
jgi:hypothetical protein